MAIIKEEQIEEKKGIIEASTNNLVIASKEFSNTITKLTEIVTDLKIVLNTTGGETQIAKLNKIDFEADANSLNGLAIQKQNIKVTYHRQRENIKRWVLSLFQYSSFNC